MATPVIGVQAPYREVALRMSPLSGYQSYWRSEDLLWQFENDLHKLLHRAGFRGSFEAKQVGRRECGTGEEGITLGRATDFVIEFHAEYGHNTQQDVWTVTFDEKDTASFCERLSRALQGEVLSPPLPPESAKGRGMDEPTEDDEESSEDQAPHTSSKTQQVAFIRRSPLVVAHCLVFAWGEADKQGRILKSTFTNIVVECMNAADKRKATAAHKSVVSQGFLKRIGELEYGGLTDRARDFIIEQREALMKSEAFRIKMAKLEALAISDNMLLASEAKRTLARTKEFLEIQD